MKSVAPYLVLAAVLSGCAGMDRWGNIYPEQCRGDLSHVEAEIKRVPQSEIPGRLATTSPGYDTWIIRIVNGIDGDLYEDVLHHERCHTLVWQWHPGHYFN